MIETLREIILDFQEVDLETGVPRHLKISTVPGKAAVCIGVRRCGKSTYLFQIVKKLLDSGIPRENILYINFFDDRLHSLSQEGLGSITEAYYSLYPEKKNTETVYCFFDEIQVMSGWEPFVNRLMQTEKCEVYITGSSSHMLSKEIATQMRGRALSWELFPFSFREFLDYRQIDWKEPVSTRKRLLIQKEYGRYWKTGGFPEVLGLDRHLRVKIHQEYFHAALYRDLIERHDISHPRAVTDLAHWLMDNVSSLYSINRLTGYLKSLGYKAPKSAVSDYLEWFEDAFFLFTVRVFDASLARSKTNPKKIYCVDHAMVTSTASGILVNTGHLLENLVFTALRRVTPDIWYCKTRDGLEVDFMARLQDSSFMLVQVCESMVVQKTRKRELAALNAAMAEYGLKYGIVVTRNEEDQIITDAGRIEVVPAWRFLLNLQEMTIPVISGDQ
jgi:predicted AAA+ superfamily ATPase